MGSDYPEPPPRTDQPPLGSSGSGSRVAIGWGAFPQATLSHVVQSPQNLTRSTDKLANMKKVYFNTWKVVNLKTSIRRGPAAHAKVAATNEKERKLAYLSTYINTGIQTVSNVHDTDAKPKERKFIQSISHAPLPPVPPIEDEWEDMNEDFNGPLDFEIPFSHAGGELEVLEELQQEIEEVTGRRYVLLSRSQIAHLTSNFLQPQGYSQTTRQDSTSRRLL